MSRISNLQTIYAEGRTLYEKNVIKLKPSSNCKVVSIKTDRTCRECGKSLEKGTRCYTMNPRGLGRRLLFRKKRTCNLGEYAE